MNTISNVKSLNNNTQENKVFNALYNSIEHTIPFDIKWNNGIGYLDGAQKVELASGKLAKSHTGDINNRKLLMMGTMFGTIVFFERFTGGDNGVIVANAPHEIRCLNLADFPSGRIGAQQLVDIFGSLYNDKEDTIELYPTTALAYKLDRMREIFSGEYTRKISKRRLAAKEA